MENARFINVLRKELIPAVGCTEPAAVALAVATAVSHMRGDIGRIDVAVSRNILKNGLHVGIPGTSVKGLLAAAALGCICGDVGAGLEVLHRVNEDHIRCAEMLMEKDIITISLDDEHHGVYARAEVTDGSCTAVASVDRDHGKVSYVEVDGQCIRTGKKNKEIEEEKCLDLKGVTLEDILHFSKTVPIEHIMFVYDSIKSNKKVAEAGFSNTFGLNIGKLLIELLGEEEEPSSLNLNSISRAAAYAAAASDARMAGCSLTVITNSGSGNQGITASLPVFSIAEDLQIEEERLVRALALSHLIAVYHKSFSDKLSAFCGAVTAAVGAGCGVTFLLGGGLKEIEHTVNTSLAGISGMICDGAKSSCALKIALSVQNSLISSALSLKGIGIRPGEGIVQKRADDTIRKVGMLSRQGMRKTDEVILDIMLSGDM
ncbi:L-cysteine desulfidase family protein [Alkalispirochaeta alkalica]|uniref:L-cysteine desulfidase family protein n=1 Tax=Alkalispirochaeta alkalica TaxID=46356 RepID=UPI0003A0A9D6|nr:L-serine ammonia-lyase, iron-sulfur-dependent, subunit alpha [Alkalispirochaeta alkalica]